MDKKCIILVLCIFSMLFFSGCSSKDEQIQESVQEMQTVQQIQLQKAQETADVTGKGYANKAKDEYYAAFEELYENNKTGVGIDDWEGDTWGEKIAIRIGTYFGGSYGAFKGNVATIIVTLELVGFSLGLLARKNKGLRRFCWLGLCVGIPCMIVVFVVVVGLVNHSYIYA